MMKNIKSQAVLYRAGGMEQSGDGAVRLSISSDTPYLRYDYWNDEEYYEVLSHDPDGINTDRLKAGAALLFNHDRHVQIGTIDNPEIKDGKCYVNARISEAPDVASHATRIKEKILKDCSVGYELIGEGICIGAKDDKPIYKFKWHPFEASLCTIAADISVGVGRQRNKEPEGPTKEISIHDKEDIDADGNLNEKQSTKTPMKLTSLARSHFMEADKDKGGAGNEKPVDIAAERSAAIAEHKKKCKAIDDFVKALDKNPAWQKAAAVIATKHKDGEANYEEFRTEANSAFTTGESLDQPTREEGGLEVIGERQPTQRQQLSPGAEFTRAQGFVKFVQGGGKGGFRSALKASYMMMRAQGASMVQRAGFNSGDLANINVTISNQLISLGVQRLTIMDLIAPGTMSTEGFLYPVENSFDPFADAAGMVPERGVKPEWEPDLTTARADAQVVAVMATIPKQFLQDFSAFQSWLDNRLDYLLQIKTEQQMLYGDGIGANLLGIANRTGVQTRAYGTVASETSPDALFRGNTDIETNSYFDPDGFAMHPYDWEQVRLLKDLNGQYIAGGPFYAPYGNGMVVKFSTIWGLPVVVSKSVKQGKPIAGAWKMGAQYFMRTGMEIETTNSHKDYFQRNLIAVLAEQRLALAVYRPIAFLEHTGFPGRS